MFPMKESHPIRTLLGLTQEQIAMMLGISRAHWAMYELGKRDLPLQPKERLAEMLQFLKTLEGTEKQLRAKENKAELEQAARMLLENEYQRLTLEKKLAAAEEKRSAQIRLSLLTDYLKTRAAKKIGTAEFTLPSRRTADDNKPVNDALLVEYRHQMALLNYEKKLLESKLKK
jgi:transcriptional regulator with XRE-family HTH domain